MKHKRAARGYQFLFGAAVLATALSACGNDAGAPPDAIAPKAGNGGTTSTAGTQSSGGKSVVTSDGGANGDAAGAGGEESMAGADGNRAGTSNSGGHSGSGSGGGAGTAGGSGVAGNGGMAGNAGTAGNAGNGGTAGHAGTAGSGGTAGSAAICGDGVVVGDECENVSTPLCSDDCRKVATQTCVDCELLSPCAEFSNNCVDWTASPTDQAICYDVQACIRSTGCGKGANSFTSCFCGALSTQMCQSAPTSGVGAPDGPCAPIIRQAMLGPNQNSVTNQQVVERFLDVGYPGGAAISRWNCDKVKCQTECGFD